MSSWHLLLKQLVMLKCSLSPVLLAQTFHFKNFHLIGSKSKASYAKDAVDSAEKEQLTPEIQVVETKDLGRPTTALGIIYFN